MSNVVILNKYESNLYDDSTGITVVLDKMSRQIKRLVSWTTRAHVPSDPAEGLPKATEADYRLAKYLLLREYLKNSDDIHVGDTVRITKGRKYPRGMTGKVTGFSSARYGYREVVTYVHLKTPIGEIKVNIQNLKRIKLARTKGRLDSVFIDLVRA